MKKYYSFVFVLVFALVMGATAASLFTASEVAAYSGDGFAPGINTQFWYVSDDLETEYPQELIINNVSYDFTLGRNTIQEYFHTGVNYVITLHPQFFGTLTPPNYDDQVNAYYVMNITDIFVLDPSTTSNYVECYKYGIGVIPDKYAITDPETYEEYFVCKVNASISDVRTGTQIAADWNGQVIYLQVPEDLDL